MPSNITIIDNVNVTNIVNNTTNTSVTQEADIIVEQDTIIMEMDSINITSISSTTSITNIDDGTSETTTVANTDDTINITNVGIQGMPGVPLMFENLTETQKVQMRGDVGDTTINYQNIFLEAYLA